MLTFATYAVPATSGQTAAGLFNLTRVLGTAGATAAVGYALRVRENGHSARLVEGITDANPSAAARLADLTRIYQGLTADPGVAQSTALGNIATGVQIQAYTLAFSDVFLAIAGLLAVFAVLVPLLPRLPPPTRAP